MSNYKRMYLQGYNFVFFTIVTNNRENILIKNKYSTFLKFVEKGYYDINWCNFDDVNNINDLNLE